MMQSLNKQLITGLILAGGRGSRMGNVDKGLQSFRGAPMAFHVMLRFAPQVGQLMINANQNLACYENFGAAVWPDELTDFAGPLAGLQAGLLHCRTPYLISVPCDAPFLPKDLVARLSQALLAADAELAVAVTREGEGEARQTQAVFCLLKTTVLPHLNAFLQQGGRKMAAWHALLPAVEVLFDDAAAFRNLNTREDLRKFEAG